MQKLIEENRIIWPDNPDGRPRKKSFFNELSDNLPGFSSIIEDGIYTNTATKEVTALFGGVHYFDFPKPSKLLKQLIEQTTESGDIILDFFSGSATTAHAVMQLNAEDGGNRRFIMVQLPEACGEKSEAYRAGYRNICEIGKERIRRAGQKLLESGGGQTPDDDRPPLDTGFRVFRLDSSNMKLWDDTPIEDGDVATLFDRIDGHIDGLKPDRSDEDLLYEILLKLGYPLTSVIAVINVGGVVVYSVEGGGLLVCLQEGVNADHIEQMAGLSPRKVVLAGRSLADSSTKANACYLLENRGITLEMI